MLTKRDCLEMSLASAIGAGIGGLLAITFSWFWLWGAVSGAVAGGLTYKPWQLFSAVCVTLTALRHMGSTIKIPDCLKFKVRIPKYHPTIGKVTFCLLRIVIVIACVASISILWSIASYVSTVFFCCLSVETSTLLDYIRASVLTLLQLGLLAIIATIYFGPKNEFELEMIRAHKVFTMPLFRLSIWLTCSFIHIKDEVENTTELSRSSTKGLSNWRDEDGRICSLRRLAKASLYSASIALLALLIPLLTLLFLVLGLLDIALSLVLLLATTKRLAVMWGSFLGTCVGYALYSAALITSPHLAITICMVIGGLLGVPLYMAREALKTIPRLPELDPAAAAS